MSGDDGYETVDEERVNASGFEEEEDSFANVDILGTRNNQEGRIKGISMIGKGHH